MANTFNFLTKMKVGTKIRLIILSMCLTIASLIAFVILSTNKEINSTKIELMGVNNIKQLQEIIYLLVLNRESNLSGSNNSYDINEEKKEKNRILKDKLKQKFIDLVSINNLSQIDVDSIAFEQLISYENNKTVSEEKLKEYEVIISDLLNSVNKVARETMLDLDPDLYTTLLINISIEDALDLFRGLLTFQNFKLRLIQNSNNSSESLSILNNIISQVENSYSDVEKRLLEFESYFGQKGFIQSKLDEARNITYTYANHLLKQLNLQQLSSDKPTFNLNTTSNDIKAFHEFYSSILNEVENSLKHRIKLAIKSRNLKLSLSLLLTSIAVLIATVTTRYITWQINAINDVFNSIENGDLTARAEVLSMDELGAMSASLNEMLNQILSLIQSQEERDAIQDSIMKLLDEVSEVAHGDLTVQAEVTEDVTGAIADSFNNMIHQLRQIVVNVQSATLQVGNSTNQIQLVAENLADGSSSQAERIVDSSAALDEIVASIHKVSEHATLSASVAEQSLNNAKQGALAVQNTIEGMHRIRSQVQETAKRIKRLGERSQEIGEIVQLINDIADRTSILALNASIQAARAGDAGRSFAVVAEEVERLAERSASATKQISSLVNAIQSETNETVMAMEESTYEVVKGSEVADQAGQALGEIENVSSRLAELIQSISLAAAQQAHGSESLSKAMGEISEVTQHTAAGTKHAAAEIRHLTVLAEELRNSVSTFRLP